MLHTANPNPAPGMLLTAGPPAPAESNRTINALRFPPAPRSMGGLVVKDLLVSAKAQKDERLRKWVSCLV